MSVKLETRPHPGRRSILGERTARVVTGIDLADDQESCRELQDSYNLNVTDT